MLFENSKKKWAIILIGIFLIAISGIFAAKPCVRWVKNWRALHLMDEAQSEEKEGHLHLAFEKAYTAYQLSPHNETIARYTAQIIEQLSQKDALAFWITLANQTQLADDFYNTVRLAIILGDVFSAKQYWGNLNHLEPEKSRTLLLQAQILALEGDFDEAALVALKAIEQSDAPEDARLLYVKLSQLSSQAVQRQSGISHLRLIAEKLDEEGLMAARTLATYPGNSATDLEFLIKQLNEHPLSTPKDKLLALSLEQKMGKVDINQVLEKAEALFEQASIDEKIELGRWLNQQGAYQKTLHCIPQSLAMERVDLFLIWADAMAITGQWLVLENALNDPNVPIEAFLKHLFLARVAEAQKKMNVAAHEWGKAFAEADKAVDKLWFLVNYAIRLTHYKEASDGLMRLTRIPSQSRLAWESLVDVSFLQNDSQAVLKVLKSMAEVYPRDVAVENDLRYIQALQGPLQDKAMARAQIMVADEPYMLAYRITLALAFLKDNKIKEGLDLLLGLNVDWKVVKPGWRCVYAGVLRANQLNTLADWVLMDIPASRLLPEEKALAGLVNSL